MLSFVEKPVKRQENTTGSHPPLTHASLLLSLPAMQTEFGKTLGLQAGAQLARPSLDVLHVDIGGYRA